MENKDPGQLSKKLPRRVLMTADTMGGVWTYAMELSRELNSLGIEVCLATMGAALSPSQREQVSVLQKVSLYESCFRLEWMEEPWQDVEAAGEWLLDLEKKLGPDIIHLNGYSQASLGWRAPKVIVAHSCVFSWWKAVKKYEPPPSWSRYHDQVSKGLAAADVVIAPSAAMLNCLKAHYSVLPGARVVYNGLNAPLSPGGGREVKRDLILTVGRLWDEAKNIVLLDNIACRLKWPAYAAGQSKCEKNVLVARNIYPLGPLSPAALGHWYGRASIFVLPARYEPFGLSALEAALSGCALVLGDIPSLREIWQDAALFVNPEDGEELKNALDRLIADRDFRTGMSSRARERAREFTSSRMASEYLKIYCELQESRICAECE